MNIPDQYGIRKDKPKDPLAMLALSLPWQGEYQAIITQHYVDIYLDDKRIHSQTRRFPDCLSKELHYAWLSLLSKFRLDENDKRIGPIGVDFKRLSEVRSNDH